MGDLGGAGASAGRSGRGWARVCTRKMYLCPSTCTRATDAAAATTKTYQSPATARKVTRRPEIGYAKMTGLLQKAAKATV